VTTVWRIHAGGPRSPFLDGDVIVLERAGIRDLRLLGEDRDARMPLPRDAAERLDATGLAPDTSGRRTSRRSAAPRQRKGGRTCGGWRVRGAP
jgi:hypothetical protein